MEYTIRWATEEDAEELGRLHTDSWRAAYREIIPEEVLNSIDPQKRAGNFRNAIANKLWETAVLVQGNEIIGLIIIGKCRDEDAKTSVGEIWGIYLAPRHYRKGFGGILFSWGVKELTNRGYEEATLWVLEENHNARSFYEKQGFSFDGAMKELTIGKKLNEVRYRGKLHQ